jgi:hypothetical protein
MSSDFILSLPTKSSPNKLIIKTLSYFHDLSYSRTNLNSSNHFILRYTRSRMLSFITKSFILKELAYFSSVCFAVEHNVKAPTMWYNVDEEPPCSELSIFASRGTTIGSSTSYYSTSEEMKAAMLYMYANVIPRSKKEGMKPPYMCPGCSNHTHGNNMINRCNVTNKRVLFLT